MRQADEITTKLVEGRSEDEVPMSEIVIDAVPIGKTVPGAILEAAVQWERFYLLFMTDDVPFEEMLRIQMLDNQFNIIDSARLGSMYSTGSFSAMELAPPNSVRFHFIGGTTWSVELLPEPAFRVPLFSEPNGVSRGLGFSRHFIVRGNPVPEGK